MSKADQQLKTVVPWYRRAGIWIGVGTGPGVVVVGGGLAAHLSLPALLLAIPLGALALTALAVGQSLMSRRLRLPLVGRVVHTFGPGFGGRLLNLMVALSMMGWFSFYVGISGFSLSDLLKLPGWSGPLIIATTLLILSQLGINRWNFVVWITTLSALAVAIIALLAVGAKPTPGPVNGFTLSELLWGIGTVISYGIVFAMRSSDFTWDLEADSDVVKSGVAFFIPFLILLGIGVLLYQATGDWNLADILARTPSAALGHLFLILAVISPSLSGLHSAVLAMESISPLKRRQGIILMCIVGFILGATRFDHHLLLFLDWRGAILPPALVLMLAAALLPQKPSARAALIAWLSGAVVAIVFKTQGQLAHIVVGAVVSLVVLKVMIFWSNATRKTARFSIQLDQSGTPAPTIIQTKIDEERC
jgi:cytosine permease